MNLPEPSHNSAPQDPVTDAEWRDAVLAAAALRQIHDCKLYGLIEGGPDINVERCDELIEKGRARGVVFSEREIRDAACEMAKGLAR
jgi:hypothetical protein